MTDHIFDFGLFFLRAVWKYLIKLRDIQKVSFYLQFSFLMIKSLQSILYFEIFLRFISFTLIEVIFEIMKKIFFYIKSAEYFSQVTQKSFNEAYKSSFQVRNWDRSPYLTSLNLMVFITTNILVRRLNLFQNFSEFFNLKARISYKEISDYLLCSTADWYHQNKPGP